ncbi:hypothetical protein [Mycobacterium sp.]|uniref:hypothetical protein n=1 Tax=Mycobacterium sp. TaxID=1785 RepID=UPI0025CB8681|nr:hypothetical protein [Mycobacterium sp.]
MSTTDETKIRPADLRAAASKASSTAQASAPKAVAEPAKVAAKAGASISPVDTAAGLVVGAIESLNQTVNTADVAAASKQMEALEESPPALQQQDQQNADDTIVAGEPLTTLQFPMLKASTPAAGGTSYA